MEEKYEIMNLLQSKQTLTKELNNLIYGSVEIREKNSNKYIYVHYREDGILLTKYVGEYSDNLYNLILNNSIKAKELKKEIKKIEKQLKQLNYIDEELSPQVEINIDFAKRHLVDTIYKQAILEGVATTFADTESIIEGGKINNMSSEDVLKIVNLKHAWEFILNKSVILSDTNFPLLCEINKFVQEGFYYSAGKIRTVPVSIGGTKWTPELPIESIIKEELEDKFNKNGLDKVEFMISTNKGEDEKELIKIASGGEMSRIMLAFKKIVGDYDHIPTMIFDEIDTGISGITASIVGKKMCQIAQSHQIICITHLPQIAACRGHNFKIVKETLDDATFTNVIPLNSEEKAEEIARLLGGINITETTIQSAKELIKASE